nr:MAG TPA: hypothetical protein [Caudoviricetes sp.]DAV59975.1 MAG TPA: hypothetical protein [Caudoviricetes sp.]
MSYSGVSFCPYILVVGGFIHCSWIVPVCSPVS